MIIHRHFNICEFLDGRRSLFKLFYSWRGFFQCLFQLRHNVCNALYLYTLLWCLGQTFLNVKEEQIYEPKHYIMCLTEPFMYSDEETLMNSFKGGRTPYQLFENISLNGVLIFLSCKMKYYHNTETFCKIRQKVYTICTD